MKSFVKILSLLFALLICFSLIACDINEKEEEKEIKNEEKKPSERNVVYTVTDNEWNKIKNQGVPFNYTVDIRDYSYAWLYEMLGMDVDLPTSVKCTENLICECDFVVENGGIEDDDHSHNQDIPTIPTTIRPATSSTNINGIYDNKSSGFDSGYDCPSSQNTIWSDTGLDILPLSTIIFGGSPDINHTVITTVVVSRCAIKYEGKWYSKKLTYSNDNLEANTRWEESSADLYSISLPCEYNELTYDEGIKAYVYYDRENNIKHFFFFEDGFLAKHIQIFGGASSNGEDGGVESVENYSFDFTYLEGESGPYAVIRNFRDYGKTNITDEHLDHSFDPDKIEKTYK